MDPVTASYDSDLDAWAEHADLQCTFGNVSRPASIVDGRVKCPTPQLPAYMASMNMTEVKLGVGASDTDLSHTFEAPVTVSSIMLPLRGPAAGNTLIRSKARASAATGRRSADSSSLIVSQNPRYRV